MYATWSFRYILGKSTSKMTRTRNNFVWVYSWLATLSYPKKGGQDWWRRSIKKALFLFGQNLHPTSYSTGRLNFPAETRFISLHPTIVPCRETYTFQVFPHLRRFRTPGYFIVIFNYRSGKKKHLKNLLQHSRADFWNVNFFRFWSLSTW